ncbi:MAG: ATP translocase [Deltaproteobacteria bacterium]|nr:ATP translocase [Deltaproteobacteria bacterium]
MSNSLLSNYFYRALVLSLEFCLIITGYYVIKPLTRTLFLAHVGSDYLPRIWIFSAILLGFFLPIYQKLLRHFSRYSISFFSVASFVALLALFRAILSTPSSYGVSAFYLLVDFYSIVLVEQFWSLTSALYPTSEGKKWYGLIGSGGLIGGMLGGYLAGSLITYLKLPSQELILLSATMFASLLLLLAMMNKYHFFLDKSHSKSVNQETQISWNQLIKSRYAIILAGVILFSQLIEPIVEFQFLKTVETNLNSLSDRTAYISFAMSALNFAALAINLTLTPLLQYYFGAIAGMGAQPLVVTLSTLAFCLQPTLNIASLLKISDRALSYSINRASKELLYIPLSPVLIYQLKSYIDMFGYRFFKILGSFIILLLTEWLAWEFATYYLSCTVIAVCAIWLLSLYFLAQDYRAISVATPDSTPA